MAATVSAYPANHAAVYRPMNLKVQRTDPALNEVAEVFIADSSDVSTLGNGLEVGDVVLRYASTVQGSIPAIVGQTILLNAGMGQYAGVHLITKAFTVSANKYAVLDTTAQGDFTPVSPLGSMRVWLNNYTVWVKVLVYADPNGTPNEIIFSGQPNNSGLTTLELGHRIKDEFSHRIEALTTGSILNAHGVTATFYRLHIAEVYDVPGETDEVDPFDGTHDIAVDDVEDPGTFRVAVNAVHPYHSDTLDWTTTNLSGYAVGGSNFARKFLTNAPRSLTLQDNDEFTVFMLVEDSLFSPDYDLPAMTLRVFDVTGPSPTFVDVIELDAIGRTSAVGFGIGPANIAPFMTVPDKYRIYVSVENEDALSEYIEVTVESKCGEGERTIAWLNKLGGIDQYTFRGREIQTSKTERAAIQRPYSGSTSFDYRRRQYRAEPERVTMVSTRLVQASTRKWLVNDLTESANAIVQYGDLWQPCIIASGELEASTTKPGPKVVTIEYTTGADNLSQQA